MLKKIALAGYFGSVGILGFKRGTHSYHYQLDQRNKDRSPNNRVNFFYFNYFMEGLIGSFLYMTPFTIIFLIPKEIYRLEVEMRGLENEKDSDWYNSLI